MEFPHAEDGFVIKFGLVSNTTRVYCEHNFVLFCGNIARLWWWTYSPSLVTYFQRCRDGCFDISECVKAKAIHVGFSKCSNLATQAVCMRARFNMCRYIFVLRGCSDTQCVICRFNMLAGIFLCFRLCSNTLSGRFVGLTCLQVYFCAKDCSDTHCVICRFNLLAGIFLCLRLFSHSLCALLV